MKKIITWVLAAIGTIAFLYGAYANLTNPSEGEAPMGLILVILSLPALGIAALLDKEGLRVYRVIMFAIVAFLILRFTGVFRLLGI